MEERVRYAAKVEEVMRWQESRIQVLLVDSDPVWQQRLTALIDAEPDMSISHIATNKESAIRASMQLDLDVMIHDPVLHSSQQDGLDTIAEVLKIKSLPIIILTSLYQPEIIVDAMLAGAINYITKINYVDVASAVREAYQGQSSLHADVASIIRNEIGLVKRRELHRMLTPTEKEILQLIGWGYTQPVVRELLGITSNTMKTHVRNIIRKFDVSSIREAAEKAKRRGLYDQLDRITC
ncbi:response regulator transcription factor [Paenibacillus validus]|uniref:response regulator n=2 Tax=Paenibacillus TaxID=44249 RepID=UPI000FDA03C9|nr:MULTISPECIES: response regulator transcription factor [Paenibacillus]MED4599689.1 response regulator transcription factor [Paenibacillus validus]MED4604878.1 response regulator transcription factor [Paenibacillus validus]NTZ19048.1 response regulator transcription factor [Paenibacillus sp. JMULE4]